MFLQVSFTIHLLKLCEVKDANFHIVLTVFSFCEESRGYQKSLFYSLHSPLFCLQLRKKIREKRTGRRAQKRERRLFYKLQDLQIDILVNAVQV